MAFKSKEQQREYQRVWIAARRAKYIALHGGVCTKCGKVEGLEFDHVDPATKVAHSIWSWKESRIQEELEKCQLLCRLCHQEKSITEQQYPERRHGTNLVYGLGCRCTLCKKEHAKVNYRIKFRVRLPQEASVRLL